MLFKHAISQCPAQRPRRGPRSRPVNLPERRSSSDPGTNGRKLRCCLRISRPPCASSECASEGCRAPGTSSSSQPSPRTSGVWLDWRQQHQLERPVRAKGPQARYPKASAHAISSKGRKPRRSIDRVFQRHRPEAAAGRAATGNHAPTVGRVRTARCVSGTRRERKITWYR
jgi:hypothetical protein